MSLVHTRYDELPTWKRYGMRGCALLLKFGMRSIVPLAFVVFTSLLFTTEWSATKAGILMWSVLEMSYYWHWRDRLRLSFKRKPFHSSKEKRMAIVQQLLDHDEDLENTLSGWMIRKPKGELHMGYYSDWILWMLFDKRREDLDPSERSQAEEIIEVLEAKVKPSSNLPLDEHTVMLPSMDAMTCYPKPFVGHLLIQGVHKLGFYQLRRLGFLRQVALGLTYWIRDGSAEPPIVYIHGIGIGFVMYLAKLEALLKAHPKRRVLLLDLPHISMAPSEQILDHDQTLAAVDVIFQKHSLGKVSLVGHSFGTILATWIIRNRPHYIQRITLVDPVCFRIWDSTLAHNFLYAEPFSFIHELMRFFVAMDPLITQTVSKELYWYESVLFPEHLHVQTTIFLSTHDWVVDALACNSYLAPRLPPLCKVTLFETSHGGCLTRQDCFSKIVEVL